MTTRKLRPVVAMALAVGIALAATLAATGRGDSSSTASSGGVRNAETLAVTDLSDDRRLVGIADDVFLGTVVRERGHTSGESLPETQFDVRVTSAVKGSLRGDVVVSQQGGLDESGTMVRVDGDSPLEIGKTYLFASLTNEATGWHTLIPRHGIRPADSPAARAGMVERFEAAEATQVPFAPES